MGLREVLEDLMNRCPALFDLVELADKFKEKVAEGDLPYGVVVVQECTRLNSLLNEIKSSLEELQKGLNGQLNMSQGMEDMAECLGLNQVPDVIHFMRAPGSALLGLPANHS